MSSGEIYLIYLLCGQIKTNAKQSQATMTRYLSHIMKRRKSCFISRLQLLSTSYKIWHFKMCNRVVSIVDCDSWIICGYISTFHNNPSVERCRIDWTMIFCFGPANRLPRAAFDCSPIDDAENPSADVSVEIGGCWHAEGGASRHRHGVKWKVRPLEGAAGRTRAISGWAREVARRQGLAAAEQLPEAARRTEGVSSECCQL